MLTLLHIENIAVIEAADISFDRGFNVLTGETGAGKSIIIDAISAILGERAYRELIRTGADRAFVSAVFDGIPVLEWFAEYQVPYEDELLIQREIFLDGRNLCRVNGRGVTVGQLRALGRQLITIHGQHDSQQLFDEQTHLGLLDAFAADGELLARYADAWERVKSCKAALDRLSMDESEKARRQEMLQFQIKELEKANLQPGEDEALEQRQKLLMNGEKLSAAVRDAITSLDGDEDSQGAAELLDGALSRLAGVLRFDDGLSGPHDRLRELSFALSDLGEELRDYRDSLGYSEEEIDEIGARLDLIHKLKRKYGSNCSEMLDYLARARAELDDIIFADEKIRQAEKAHAAAVSDAREIALRLRQVRQDAAAELERRVCSELAELNMPKVQFLCEFSEVPLGAEGLDGLRFLMSANLGEAVKPLSKVASGGELARIMLAMKNVLSEGDPVSTMIFDEIDTGISGHTAVVVGRKLAEIAGHRQIISVTHLPQIAAYGDDNYLISKSIDNAKSYTSINHLDDESKVRMIAALFSGSSESENALEAARELIAAAEK